MNLAREFLNQFPFRPALFYVWGHAYEFDDDNNWQRIEALADLLVQHREEVWFATNGEIIDYVTAYRRLEYSADGSILCNPSALDVTIRTSMHTVQTVRAGQYVAIAPKPL